VKIDPVAYSSAMLKDATARDLALLTIAKIAILTAIYFAFFASYDGRPVDTAAHLLGPASQTLTATNSRGY